MAKKIKLSDAAKDFNVPSQELIDFFAEKGDNKKKTGSSLSEEEMNSLLEHYTKGRYSVNSLDEYFNSKNDPRPVKERQRSPQRRKRIKKRRRRLLPQRRQSLRRSRRLLPLRRQSPRRSRRLLP